jgi:RNA polymerase sigma-70 factor (ECF subfamily)
MYLPPVLEALGLAEVEQREEQPHVCDTETQVSQTPPSLASAREQFLAIVDGVRPELHRYCARLTGSVIEGEDIVQETLAKAFYALSLSVDVPPLRPWLFRIAHNTAMDFLKSHGRRFTDPTDEIEEVAGFEDKPDPAVVRAALARFLTLPVTQRSATILKDVLGHSLEETAETMGTTVMAVKAALVRGRGKLRATESEETEASAMTRADLDRYATLFNARDWDGVRALISEDCRLDVVSKSQRRGKQVGLYFERYEKENVTLRVVRLEGQLAFAAYTAGSDEPAYFVLLELEDGRVKSIRDFRYVPYIVAEADFDIA